MEWVWVGWVSSWCGVSENLGTGRKEMGTYNYMKKRGRPNQNTAPKGLWQRRAPCVLTCSRGLGGLSALSPGTHGGYLSATPTPTHSLTPPLPPASEWIAASCLPTGQCKENEIMTVLLKKMQTRSLNTGVWVQAPGSKPSSWRAFLSTPHPLSPMSFQGMKNRECIWKTSLPRS